MYYIPTETFNSSTTSLGKQKSYDYQSELCQLQYVVLRTYSFVDKNDGAIDMQDDLEMECARS